MSVVPSIILPHYLQQVEEILRSSPCRNNFGPNILTELTTQYLDLPGKRLRPSLVIAGCGLFGGDPETVIPVAAAYEVFHNWTLVHDDIIDQDHLRRGQPTSHCQAEAWGLRQQLNPADAKQLGWQTAILIGDNLQAWCINLFLQIAEQKSFSPEVIFSELKRLTGEAIPFLIHGEMADVLSCYYPIESIKTQDICEMMRLKTSILFQYALTTGAALGKNCPYDQLAEGSALERFATACGIAFQLQDDILGVKGDVKKLGKSIGSDLREGKRTLLLSHALQQATPAQREFLLKVIGQPQVTEEQVREVQLIFDRTGAFKAILTFAEKQLHLAQESLATLPDNPWRTWLQDWANQMIHREK